MNTPKRTIPGVFDELVEVDFYLEKHRPEHQSLVGQGYPLNPVLREDFWNTPNDHREWQERQDWWDLPYIESTSWSESETGLRRAQQARKNKPSSIEADAEIESHRASFHAFAPGGTKYTVQCLDGGAWDRPTMWGTFSTLDEAIDCCSTGPAWRNGTTSPPTPKD
jgi:hypothetical protein